MTHQREKSHPADANGAENHSRRWGVVVVAHGSQRGASPTECSCSWQTTGSKLPAWCLNCPSTPRGLQEATDRLQAALGTQHAKVELSCLEFIEPRPDQTIHNLVNQGMQQIVVIPYLLGQGKHVTLEMDEVLEEVRGELPGLGLYLAEALGPDPRMADVVVGRVRDLEASLGTKPVKDGPIGVLLVKAGTKNQYDDCLWLEELGRLVENGLGLGYAVAVAQSHYGDPTVETAGATLVEERRVSTIVVVPYVFFPGMILKRNILGEMERLAEKYPGISLKVTPPLGVDERLVEVAADRVRQVWHQVGQ